MSLESLRAMYIAGRGQNVPESKTFAVVVGVAFELRASSPVASATFALTSKPGGSTASFTGGVVTPDVVGGYAGTMTMGSVVRPFSFIAVPSSALTFPALGPAALDVLGAIASDPSCDTSSFATMTTARPFPLMFALNGNTTPNFVAFGAPRQV